MTTAADEEDAILGQMNELAGELKSEFDGFKKRSKGIADPVAAGALLNLFSLFTDFVSLNSQAHGQSFEWGKGIDEAIDELQTDTADTRFLPEDAMRLKSLLLALQNNLRAPTDEADDVPEALRKQVAEAILFIDEATLDPDDGDDADDEGDGDEETDDDADPENDDTN